MSNKRENLTWLPFAFLGLLNFVGLLVLLWGWGSHQVVPSNKMHSTRHVVVQSKDSWRLSARWKVPVFKRHIQKVKATKKAEKKYPFKMNLLSI